MKHKGYFLVLATAIISGFSIFINKFGVSVGSPYIFTFLKNALVAIFLSAIIIAFKEHKNLKALNKKQRLVLFLIGLIGGSIPFLLFFKGLSLTNAAGASFIQKTMFLWIFLLAGFFLKEKLTKKYIAAGCLLLIGNLLLLKLSDIRFDKGSLLVFAATLFWAVENVVSKYALKEIPPKIVMWSRMFFGSVFILIFLAMSHQLTSLANLNSRQIGWTLVSGVLLFGYVATWYTGLKYIKVTEASIILMLGSPITTLLATIFAKSAAGREYVAMIFIVLGVLAAFKMSKITNSLKQIYVRARS
ncbi:MAG: DMT family transporter [bacterium]|nr:DMT family transporter [bacterium]